MGGVEEHRDAGDAAERLDARRVARRAEHVGGDERAGAVERLHRRSGVDLEAGRVAGDEPRRAVVPRHRVACGREREARHHDRAGPVVGECLQREHQTRRARADRDDVRDAEALGDALFELGDEGAVGEDARLVRGLEPAMTRSSGGRAGRANGTGRMKAG